MTIKEILSRPKSFQFMLLARLETDLQRGCGSLWGIDIETHKETMNALYEALDIKLSKRFVGCRR